GTSAQVSLVVAIHKPPFGLQRAQENLGDLCRGQACLSRPPPEVQASLIGDSPQHVGVHAFQETVGAGVGLLVFRRAQDDLRQLFCAHTAEQRVDPEPAAGCVGGAVQIGGVDLVHLHGTMLGRLPNVLDDLLPRDAAVQQTNPVHQVGVGGGTCQEGGIE